MCLKRNDSGDDRADRKFSLVKAAKAEIPTCLDDRDQAFPSKRITAIHNRIKYVVYAFLGQPWSAFLRHSY
jgi:hypothetical protein